ncbi:DNA-directed RNA polymerase subunit alpha [bacterium]|jgi:DNA-directed RNA polymerase subunit alpha|nr:DNA-directed RNA polymerase subunit alpha [bacterium]
MRLKDFEMPKRLICDEETASDSYGKFTAEPFERGYGHTIGNSLRRILLSSLEGAAVSAVKIKGVMHEFSTIPGVVEDVTEIILNLKSLRFRLYSEGPEKIYLNATKKGEVAAKDIKLNSNIEILNPSTHIVALDRDTNLEMEIEVSKGRGYLPAEKNPQANQQLGVISVDAIFTPVLKVNYEVENARVGRSIDYDRLILEIWTDGSVKPVDALAYASKILKDSLNIFISFEEQPEEEEKPPEKDKSEEVLDSVLALPVNIIELTVRSINCLNRAKIKTIGDLVKQTEDKLLSFRNFGKKSLNEIKKKIAELGKQKGVELSLGMTLPEKFKEKEKK